MLALMIQSKDFVRIVLFQSNYLFRCSVDSVDRVYSILMDSSIVLNICSQNVGQDYILRYLYR